MAKQTNQRKPARYAVNQTYQKQAQERAAQEQTVQDRRARNTEKNRHMSSAFLFAVLSLIGLFCLYTLLHTLFFPASSVSELRDQFLFVSLVAIPYLLAAVAVVVHRLLKTRRESWSARGRRLSSLLYLAVLVTAFVLFGWQFLQGKRDASAISAYTQTVSALEQSGQTVTGPEQVEGMQTLLEYAFQADMTCGSTEVRLHSHTDRSGWVTARFQAQASRDYADFPHTQTEQATVWGPVETEGAARAAVAYSVGDEIRVIELVGPLAELEELVPLLAAP